MLVFDIKCYGDGNMAEESKWMTVKEASAYLKVSQMTMFRWMKSGKLTHYKMGSSVRFTKDDLDALAKPSMPITEERVSNLDESESSQNLKAVVVETKPAEPKKFQKEEFCLMCGFDNLIDGHVQSTGKVYFKPLKTRFWAFVESTIPVNVKMCSRCGYLHQFADTSKMEQLNPED
jgi:excisionase family DNA binding protein